MLDALITNAAILTQDSTRPTAHSVGVWQGKIVALDDQAQALKDPRTEVIDLRGATLVPGFNDVHTHSVWFGQTLREIDLSGIGSAEEVYALLSAHLPDNPGAWVIASGYHQAGFGTARPTLAGLDAATAGHPLLIKHNTGHSYTVNSNALRLAGIDPFAPPEVEGGRINVDADGYATGLLDENAMRLIQDVLLPESRDDIVDALHRATGRYLAEGITSVTDAGVAGGWIGHSPREFGDYQAALQLGKLHTRVQAMVTMDALHTVPGHAQDPEVYTLDAGLRTGLGDDRLQLGPVKMFIDGSMLGRTAAMTQPYCHCEHGGYFQEDADDMRDKALGAVAGGWTLAMHTIGDAAIDLGLDIIEEANARFGHPVMPHRLEHGSVLRADQLPRLAAAGVVVCPQPRYIFELGDPVAEVLGSARSLLSYPGGRLLAAGLTLPGSSDRPVVDGHPLKGIQSFVERRTATGAPFGEDHDKLTVAQALYAFTAGSAAATGWAGRKGQIRPGQLADFAVLDRNPHEVPTSELSDIRVTHTFLGGKLAYVLP
ncbi:amidohydrolase [Corynebacterium phocae]|uniref:Amidohydrolase n=1 Tax=Corynebacterium phocae TaxID=161895 RepID=A0A1L7D4I3_9CORY|nr:amidohydrolase [Corynebacterium phocae]APT93054.1 amidohydrolase [Corynebacterium phocae]KAA8722356.1 amidohydrolase [Corynebacterium phocae]